MQSGPGDPLQNLELVGMVHVSHAVMAKPPPR